MKKKVTISIYDDIGNPYYAGGGASAVKEIAGRLRDEYEVTVVTGNYRGASDLTVSGIKFRRIGWSFTGPRLSQLLFHLFLVREVRKADFDIWIECFTPPFSTSFLPAFTHRPVVGWAHMLSAEDMERKYKLPFRLIEDAGLKLYRHVIVVTEAFREKILSANRHARVYVVPNGIGRIDDEIRPRKSRPYILFIGRLEMDQKGLDLLIDAYTAISGRTDVPLLIAGGGSLAERQAIERHIHTRNLQGMVTCLGKVEGSEKARLLGECMLVVIPSRFETFSLVALEAMAHGKPIVSFDIKGLSWVPEGCILRVRPFDRVVFGEKILALIASPKTRQNMAVAAREAAADYTWEKSVRSYLSVVSDIINAA